MQIRVPELSLASAWTGPPIEPYSASWVDDAAVADLAQRVAQRRMPIEQAEHEIGAFADAAGAHRRASLLALEAGVFSTLATERALVMTGLDRYGRRQRELATGLRGALTALRAAEADPAPDPHVLATAQQAVAWQTRLFEQRRQSMSAVCDVPTRIERRLFLLTRIVQALVE